MYPRTNYEMTEVELKELLDACKPTPCIMIGGSTGPSPQENANRAWELLGKKKGFDHMTVQAVGKGQRFFSAIPSENETQRVDRLAREAKEKRLNEINKLQVEITEINKHLVELRKPECKGIELGDGSFSGCTGTGGDCPICGK